MSISYRTASLKHLLKELSQRSPGLPVSWMSDKLRKSLELLASKEVLERRKRAEELAAQKFPCQEDKVSHAGMSALLSGVVTQLTGDRLRGLSVTLGIGATKELLVDGTFLNPHGTPEFRGADMEANVLGALIGAGFEAAPQVEKKK